MAKNLLVGWSCFPIKNRARKIWKATPLCLFWAVWMERNRIVFDDVPFSLSRQKTSFVSLLVYRVGGVLYCKNSFVHSIDFLVDGRFFDLFCIGQVPPCVYPLYTMRFLGSLFLFVSIFLLSFPIKKKSLESSNILNLLKHCFQ